MFDYKAHGIAAKRKGMLELCAGQIAALDHSQPLSLIDLGEILDAAANEVDEAAMEAWATERCDLTLEQHDLARQAHQQLKPHYQRLQKMGASNEMLITLLKGFDEDVDHGVDALETYGPIAIADLEILMGAAERPADSTACHPLLRLSRTAMAELIALKTQNGLAILLEKITHLIGLVSRLEAIDFGGRDAEFIRRDLTVSAQEAIALFENLALLPHRRVADPDVLHASWPPVASAWSSLYEALSMLEFSDGLNEEKAATVREVLAHVLAER